MSANDFRSNSMNPNIDAYEDCMNNQANQFNPNWPSKNPGVPSGNHRGNNPPGKK